MFNAKCASVHESFSFPFFHFANEKKSGNGWRIVIRPILRLLGCKKESHILWKSRKNMIMFLLLLFECFLWNWTWVFFSFLLFRNCFESNQWLYQTEWIEEEEENYRNVHDQVVFVDKRSEKDVPRIECVTISNVCVCVFDLEWKYFIIENAWVCDW